MPNHVQPSVAHRTLVVHGLWDSVRRIAPLVTGLRARGVAELHAVELIPASGSAPIEQLAEQVARDAARLLGTENESAIRLNIVGFSMGALVSRYYLQCLGGDSHVDSFVSISGPHRGTLTAYAGMGAGIQQMRPGSDLLRAMGTDVSALSTKTYCIYTPFDAMIVPPRSAVLDGAASVHAVRVPFHRAMLRDARVLDLTASLLTLGSTALRR